VRRFVSVFGGLRVHAKDGFSSMRSPCGFGRESTPVGTGCFDWLGRDGQMTFIRF